MELAPRYCRSCGSRILVKNVCHNCNNDPLKGDNYCYDCGSLTPNAEGCLKCGARYKRSLPIKPIIIIGSIVIIATAVAAYFISHSGDTPTTSQPEKIVEETTTTPGTNTTELPVTQDTIVNNPVDTIAVINPIIDSSAIKTPATDTVKKTESNVFSLEERKLYNIRCSYFSKNQRSRVLFFIAGSSGYIKANGSIYELKRKRKGVDVAVFGNNEYEATLTIDGLSGTAREWLASCTLSIKDIIKNTSVRHKVYSPCIEL